MCLVFNLYKTVFTKTLSCLIILLNVQIYAFSRFMPFLGSVQMYSGQHVVNIDFLPLGWKSDCKEGGILGINISNLNLEIFFMKTTYYQNSLNIPSDKK